MGIIIRRMTRQILVTLGIGEIRRNSTIRGRIINNITNVISVGNMGTTDMNARYLIKMKQLMKKLQI